MTIYINKGLTRNLETRDSPIWVLPNIFRLRWVRDTKFGTDVPNEMLLHAAKCQGYSFFHFWVINGKSTGVVGGGGILHRVINDKLQKSLSEGPFQ